MKKLNSEDYKTEKELICKAKAIDELYLQLSDLEISGLKESTKYQATLYRLRKAIEEERKVYKCSDFSDEKIEQYLKHFTDSLPFLRLNGTEELLLQDYSHRVTKRIMLNLSNIIRRDSQRLEALLFPKKIVKKMQDIDADLFNMIKNSLNVSMELSDSISNDVLNTFITLIEKDLNSEPNESVREAVIKTKYNAAFTNMELEETMLETGFNPINRITASSILTAKRLRIKKEDYKDMMDAYIEKIVIPVISSILAVDDENYKKEKIASSLVLRVGLIRAGFLHMTDNKVNEINYLFHELLDDPMYFKAFKNNKQSEEAIIEAFKTIKKDKSQNNVFTLK